MGPQRIVTFLPSATELIYSLGADDKLFGVTHECNYPSGAKTKPRVISSVALGRKVTMRCGSITHHYQASNKSDLTIVEFKKEYVEVL